MTSNLRARGLLLTLGLLAFIPSAARAEAVPTAQGDAVSLNFANADIEAVIKAIGKISGKNFLIDPRVKGTLNIVTNTPVSRDLSYQILLSALRLQGYTAVEGPGVTKIVPEADAKLHGVPVGKDGARGRGDSLVTQVFAMRHESATQMLPVVRPLVSPNNTVTAFPSNNVLVVTDYAENVARIARIIESIDVAQGDVVVLELQHAAATDLAATLNRLMNEAAPAAGGAANGADATQRVQIVPDARTNSLLVRAENPSRISALRQLVASLDRPGAGGNIHVVYLKNAEATKVAQTLNAALAGETGASAATDVRATTGTAAVERAPSTDRMGTQPTGLGGGTSSGYRTSSLRPANGTATATSGGIVQADAYNNALIILAPEAIYRNLRHVIDLLDRRRAQVYIEALIAEISTERAAEYGIQWQSANTPGAGSRTTLFGGTNFSTGGQNIIGAAQNIGSVGKGMNFLLGGGTVKVPINGEMVEVFNLSLLARFLETDARANILSTPSLVTLDNEPAKIVVGQNLPFVTGQYANTGGGTTPANPFQTIERKDVGLTLEVRPQISEGGAIRLDIYQEASAVVPTIDDSNGPTTNKRSIESSVLVDDGAIIALGGLVQDDYSGGIEKVPVLGDLPIAGSLFRYDTRRRAKTNLVVFLRPVILRDRDSYTDLTNARYDYVIGEQRGVAKPGALMGGERTPPELPPAGSSAPALPTNHLPAVPGAAVQPAAPVVETRPVR